MENKSLTAVEWLAEQFKRQGFLYDLDIEAAKQMEKEEIKNAWKHGDGEFDKTANKFSEQYYNKRYTQSGTE